MYHDDCIMSVIKLSLKLQWFNDKVKSMWS